MGAINMEMSGGSDDDEHENGNDERWQWDGVNMTTSMMMD
jgi:hypothetical protein